MAYGLATGETWFRVPETIEFHVDGTFDDSVSTKDFMLHIVGEYGTDVARYKAIEFRGPAIEPLPIDDRTTSDVVGSLMERITVEEAPEPTERFNTGEQPYTITVETTEGIEHRIEKTAFEGHPSNPMSWEQLEAKFHRIAKDVYEETHRNEIIQTVKNLEAHDTTDLTDLLSAPVT